MLTPSASAFSDAAWMRAVLAHVPRAAVVVNEPEARFHLLAARRSRVPVPHLQSLTAALTPSPLPSVAGTPGETEAAAFLNRLDMPLVLRGVTLDNPVTAALIKGASHVRVLKSWHRAALDLNGDFDTWLNQNFDHKRRKELKRLKARLAEQGTLTLEELTPGGDLASHIKAFLEVEASGWKGRRGTAILNSATTAQGLAAGLAAMFVQGKVRFWTMYLDRKPVASLFALVNNGEAVLGKIGYDQAFAKFSPGVLVIIEATRALFAEPGLRLADSNAIPGHPMIDRIWRDRIPCADVVIAGSSVSATAFALVSRYHGTKDAMRMAAKRIYLSVSGRRAS